MVTGLKSITPIWLGFFRVTGAAVFVLLMTAFTGNLVKPQRQDIPMIITISIFRLSAVMVLVFFALKLGAGRSGVGARVDQLAVDRADRGGVSRREESRSEVGRVGLGVVGVFVISQIWTNDWGDTDVLARHGPAAAGGAGQRRIVRVHPRSPMDDRSDAGACRGSDARRRASSAAWVDRRRRSRYRLDSDPRLGDSRIRPILASGLAFWSQIVVLRNNRAGVDQPLDDGCPGLGVLSSAIFLDERITLGLTIGIVLVFVGVSINLLSE